MQDKDEAVRVKAARERRREGEREGGREGGREDKPAPTRLVRE